nr:uncharacterized protein LOC115108986 isoform X2 [Oncorhynchus nerka]
MNGSMLPICLALCLAGWAVSGASIEDCTGIVSTDQMDGAGGLTWSPDPIAPTMTPDGTGRLSKETRFAIVSIPIAFSVIFILIVVLRRRTRSSVVWCPHQRSTSEVHSEQYQTQLKLLKRKVDIV